MPTTPGTPADDTQRARRSAARWLTGLRAGTRAAAEYREPAPGWHRDPAVAGLPGAVLRGGPPRARPQ
ncbi:hypothetical protein, partial [Streptomyces sp. 8L]|uniref:hypothetical protein n=1 Tax=Streptomyces sp. 8L TaxID=2877242 RepID=UPI001CD2841C